MEHYNAFEALVTSVAATGRGRREKVKVRPEFIKDYNNIKK